MRIAIMQPYVFPYIGYFQLIDAVDKFIFYNDVNYITRGWINRNNILINNKATLFSVPLRKASQNRLINEIEISDEQPWRQKFLRGIEITYKKALYFKDAYQVIEGVICDNQTHIHHLAQLSILAIADYLEVSTKFVGSSDIYMNRELKAQERILNICKIESATEYINPIGGMEIYSRDLFKKNGVNINFLKSRIPSYRQFADEFVPSLSIIDVVMFNSPHDIRQMLLQYDLI